MKKSEIKKILKKYNFDKNEYLVISGAAMVLLGIKDNTTDIDISVTKKYFEYLLKNYNCVFERVNEFNESCYLIDNIINFSVTYYDSEKIFINNIPIQRPNKILKLKQNLNREKDINDVKLIKEFINE